MRHSRDVIRTIFSIFLVFLVGACGRIEQLPGTITVGAYRVPNERLAAWAPALPVSDAEGKWVTPNFLIEPHHNPYRVVVDFEAELTAALAIAEIDFDAVWLVKQDRQSGGPLQRLRFDKLSLRVAGDKVSGQLVGFPLSFREQDIGAIEINLNNRVGIKPTGMVITVRSGFEEIGWLETLLSFQSLMVGLVFLLLVLWMRR